MNFRHARVLVTGGTGFVGAHLVERLVMEGAQVVTTFQTLQPESYFSRQRLESKVTMAQVDVNNFEAVHHIVTKFDIEYVFHLAAQPLVEVAYYNPRQTLETNISGTINVLESARLYPKIKAVIVASSDKAYGKLETGKYLETDPLRGDHPYEVSKSAADLITSMYFKMYQVPAVTSRFGNIYGAGDLNFSRIVPAIMKTAITGEKLELRSNGKFVRDYLHVKDVVSGYLLLAELIKKTKGEAYNFGSDDTLSVVELIKMAEPAIGKKIPYLIRNTSKNEIPYQSLDFTKAQTELGWKQRQTVSNSFADILMYYQGIL
jgi:CDP-glucose 4,6-dehydratase